MRADDRVMDLSAEEGARVVALGLLAEARAAAERLAPRHEKELKRLARSTNEARDAEVQLRWLETKRDALPSARQRAGYDLVVDRFGKRAHDRPDAAKVADRFHRVAEKLERRLRTYERKVEEGGEPGPTFGGVLSSLIDDHVKALAGRMDAIREPWAEEVVHRARIEGKRLRYLLEPLRGSGPAAATDVVGRL
jgi:CHAD domain-containing protein